MKEQGRVVFWSDSKQYGLIAVQVPAASGGYRVENYFMPASRIIFAMSENYIGKFARFEISPASPRNPGEYKAARNIELFDTAEQMSLYAQAMLLSEVK